MRWQRRDAGGTSRWGQALAGLLLAGLLAACATPLSTQVSRFNAWSPDYAGARFAFIRAADPWRELEQASYEALVEAELTRLGLQRSLPGQPARIAVDLAVSAQLEQRSYLRPVYQDVPVLRPPWRDAAGRLHPGFWAPDPFGPRLVGQQQVGVSVQVSTLSLRLIDQSPGAPAPRTVFESTARHEAVGTVALPQIVPWLVRAVFHDFPGRNGQVTELRFDPKTGQVIGQR